MSHLSLGLIETVGLAAAIEAADAALKSANVALVGYELTKGDGMVVVKVEGEVGAITAAIDAASVAAARISTVISALVIPRPAEGVAGMVASPDTVGVVKAAPPVPEPATPPEPVPESPPEPTPEPLAAVDATAADAPPEPSEPPAPPAKGPRTPSAPGRPAGRLSRRPG